MSVLDACDAVAKLLEPDPTFRDDARARPPTYEPGRLYFWPRRETFAIVDMGETPGEERFWLRAAWGISADHEMAALTRSRETTEALHHRADTMAVLVATNQSDGVTRDHLRVEDIDYEALNTSKIRGFYLDLYGYKYRSETF